MEDYIIVYYYSKKERNWIVEVRDENNKVLASNKSYTEDGVKEQALNLKKEYKALRISKTDIK